MPHAYEAAPLPEVLAGHGAGPPHRFCRDLSAQVHLPRVPVGPRRFASPAVFRAMLGTMSRWPTRAWT